jgi:glyoxalase family protein
MQANEQKQAIAGLHHVTAITADAQKNIDFYTETLGLRLVKVTVNYDDPTTYHLYYGDGLGRPGTILTFFVWPGGMPGQIGRGQVGQTAYAIPAGSVAFWQNRLEAVGITTAERFGQTVLTIKDPDGLEIELIGTATVNDQYAWQHGSVPPEHAIRGFHSVTLLENDVARPASVLENLFGYRKTAEAGHRTRFESAAGGLASIVDVVAVGPQPLGHSAAGTVHHVAFRTPDDTQQLAWQNKIATRGLHVSPVMDRDYFHSIYFREPGGVLFEIATDGPGMTINEPAETLGMKLALPVWMEYAREKLQQVLPPIKRPNAGAVAVA